MLSNNEINKLLIANLLVVVANKRI